MDVFLYFLFTISGLTLMKSDKFGLNLSFADHRLSLNAGAAFIAGAFAYIVSFLIYITLVRKYDLSFLLPFVNGIVIISSTLIGILVFRESVSLIKILGIGLIISGLVLINLKGV